MSRATTLPVGYVLVTDGIHNAGGATMAGLPIEQACLVHEITQDLEELSHALGKVLDDPNASGLRRSLLLRIIALNSAAMDVLGGEPITTDELREVVRGPRWMQSGSMTVTSAEGA